MARLPQNEIRRENLREPEKYGQLPEGDYDVIVSKTDYDVTPFGTENIRLEMKVMNGPLSNRLLIDDFCMAIRLENENDDEARRKRDIKLKIGEQNLNSAMKCADLTVLNDTDNFLNKMFHVKVTYNKNNYMIVTYSKYKGTTTQSYTNVQNSTFNEPDTSQFHLGGNSNQNQGFVPPARQWGN